MQKTFNPEVTLARQLIDHSYAHSMAATPLCNLLMPYASSIHLPVENIPVSQTVAPV